MKGALTRAGDKLGVSNKSRAPQDDGEYNMLAAKLTEMTKKTKDLEVRVTLLNGSITKMITDNEKLCVQAAGIFGPLAVGKNGDFAGVKQARKEHEERYQRVQEQLKSITDEMKSLQKQVDERHKLGAEHEKKKKVHAKKKEKGEEDEAEAEEEDRDGGIAYQVSHDRSLSALKTWNASLQSRYTALYQVLQPLQLGIFGMGPTASSEGAAMPDLTQWVPPVEALNNLKFW